MDDQSEVKEVELDGGEGEWLIHIKQGIEAQTSIARPSTVSIFTVPKILIDLKPDAYLPQVVSIGPCFHRTADFSEMISHKQRAVQRITKRLQGKTDIYSVVAEIETMDGQIRDKYQKIVNCDSQTLAWMMLLDGSFLLELLRTLSGASSLPSVQTRNNLCNQVLPSVSMLSKAVIRIRPYTGDGGMALGFGKETSVLYLPIIMISENTETVLRNLMAIEAFLPLELQVISCYVGLMDSLIYSERDATTLRMAGVFCIYVGNDAKVAQLWENLCKGMAISSLEPLMSLKNEIIECYRSKWRAKLVEFSMNSFTRHKRANVSLLVATHFSVYFWSNIRLAVWLRQGLLNLSD